VLSSPRSGRIGFIIGRRDGLKSRIVILSVDQENRRKGVGSELLNKYLEIMKKQRIKAVTLMVEVTNRESIDFYLHREFEIKKKLPNIYKDGA
jgi:ribosomal-protein-alanine N-acetyltransferase